MQRSQSIIDYLATRRSMVAMNLEDPGPVPQELTEILTIASRVPDHGKLAPWRFVIYSTEVRLALAQQLSELASATSDRSLVMKRQKELERFQCGPLAIGVISQAVEHPKIPLWEQQLSAGAVCMKLLMTCNAFGYEAQWLTGWHTSDPDAASLLGLLAGEKFAGIVHIGSSTIEKTDRGRPDLADIVTHHTL